MFEWFDKTFRRREYPTWKDVPDLNKVSDDMKKVIPFPELKAVPEQPAKVFYRIGVTDKNRVALSMGMMEITMTKAGVENLIQQLQVFRDQLTDEQDEE